MKRLVLAAILLAAAAAQPAPAQLTPNAERAWLFEALRTAPSEEIGQAVADQVWRFWMSQAPDAASAEIMNKALERRRQYDLAGAVEYLDQLVVQAPDWSEAWNQRATILFMQEKYDRSLADVDRVLELEPKHFGALAGKAVMLMRQGRIELGQRALRKAVEVHPWLAERRMLLPTPGQEL